MDKKIYILMATYNGEKYIKEQIDSILNQTYKNWTLIIHDDNSKDKTIEIIKEYVKKYSNKIKFMDDNIATGGSKENFTYLLDNIDNNFDYIMFSDQDDVWIENKIESTLKKMIEIETEYPNKPILIHTDLKVVDENLNIISPSMFKYQKLDYKIANNIKFLLVQNVLTGCTIMLNNLAFNIILPIDKNAIMHDWWIGLKILSYNGKIEFLNKQLILYRQHNSNDIGAKQFTFSDMLKRVNSLFKYKMMANALNLNISLLEICINKLSVVLRRF